MVHRRIGIRGVRKTGTWEVAWLIKCLPNILKALSTILSKKKKRRRRWRGGGGVAGGGERGRKEIPLRWLQPIKPEWAVITPLLNCVVPKPTPLPLSSLPLLISLTPTKSLKVSAKALSIALSLCSPCLGTIRPQEIIFVSVYGKTDPETVWWEADWAMKHKATL